MKKIEISNGEVRIGYEYNETPKDIQDEIVNDFIQFEINTIHSAVQNDEEHPLLYLVEEMEKMQTPWFLAEVIWEKEKDYILGIIEANEYLFDEEGDILPITRHYEKNKLIKITYGSKERECTITEMKQN